MSNKTFKQNPDGSVSKMDGWFSWRHKTREACDAARERYLSQHGPAARRRRAAERKAAS